MRKMIKAFRRFRGYTRKFGGAVIFWDCITNKWQVAPVAIIAPLHKDDNCWEMKLDADKCPTFYFD